jgi:hypothetical protein
MARFAPGQSGNPGGRPSPAKAALRDALDKTVGPVKLRRLWRTLYGLAEDGDLEAIKLIFAYAYGKPTDNVQISGDADEPLAVAFRWVRAADATTGRPQGAARSEAAGDG